MLTREEEFTLIAKAQKGDKKAIEKIVTEHLFLPNKVARSLDVTSLDIEDLQQEGVLGLMHAIKKFDRTKGVRFADYATYWVRDYILKYIDNQSRTIRFPSNISKDVDKLRRTRNILRQELKTNPTDEELADRMEVSPKYVKDLGELPFTMSFDSKMDENDTLFSDFMGEDSDFFDDCMNNEAISKVDMLLSNLPIRENLVIKMRFGLSVTRTPLSLREIGELLDVSYERVRQIEMDALELLRKYRLFNMKQV